MQVLPIFKCHNYISTRSISLSAVSLAKLRIRNIVFQGESSAAGSSRRALKIGDLDENEEDSEESSMSDDDDSDEVDSDDSDLAEYKQSMEENGR